MMSLLPSPTTIVSACTSSPQPTLSTNVNCLRQEDICPPCQLLPLQLPLCLLSTTTTTTIFARFYLKECWWKRHWRSRWRVQSRHGWRGRVIMKGGHSNHQCMSENVGKVRERMKGEGRRDKQKRHSFYTFLTIMAITNRWLYQCLRLA